jgi:hypothetical protein
MLKWYRLIKWVKQQRKKQFHSFNVVVSSTEFIIWNPKNDEQLRIKY